MLLLLRYAYVDTELSMHAPYHMRCDSCCVVGPRAVVVRGWLSIRPILSGVTQTSSLAILLLLDCAYVGRYGAIHACPVSHAT
jgi:hypothetical protein